MDDELLRAVPQLSAAGLSGLHANTDHVTGAPAGQGGDLVGDDLLEELMARRAARHAPEHTMGQQAKRKAVLKADRIRAIACIKEQLEELARIRAAAEAAGWLPGFAEDPHDPLPPLGHSTCGAGSQATRAGGEAPLPAAGGVFHHSGLTVVLEATELQADAACAARATDLWETAHRDLINEAARAHRRIDKLGHETEEVLQRLRQRVNDEVGRRALMRKYGAHPKAGLLDKTDRAPACRIHEGVLVASRTIANEFEAAVFLETRGLCARLEAARPGHLGKWHELDVDVLVGLGTSGGGGSGVAAGRAAVGPTLVALAARAAGCQQDAGPHLEAACKRGLFVGRMARMGLTREHPFLIQAGLEYSVCDQCGEWVDRKDFKSHGARCVGDARGRPRVFRESWGSDLGSIIHFRHSAGMVEIKVMVPFERALRSAISSCLWKPDEMRCSWRLVKRGEGLTNRFPRTEEVPAAAPAIQLRPEGPAGAVDGDGSDVSDCGDGEDEFAAQGPDCGAGDGQAGACTKRSSGAPGGGPNVSPFRLRDASFVQAAHQPISILKPLTYAQLHTLGWLLKREEHSDGFWSAQSLEQGLAETDVGVELRIERLFRYCRGGIMADQIGFGKTGCVIALIAHTRGKPVSEQLTLQEWPHTAGQRVLTDATLIVTPPNLFEQWLREFRRFADPAIGLVILAVPNHSKLKTLTIADFVAADVVLVSYQLFFSEAYRRYFDELTKPGLKVWDEASVAQRQNFNRQRVATHAKPGKGKGRGKEVKKTLLKGKRSSMRAVRLAGTAELGTQELHADDEPCGSQLDADVDGAGATEAATEAADGSGLAATGAAAVGGRRPGLKVSRYYAELKSRKDYHSARYADLQRRTRRMIRDMSAEELSQSRALFEMFYFKRVVFDECHAVALSATKAGVDAVSFRALHALQGHSHWGLTATPFLSGPQAVARMASLLRVYVPAKDEGEAQRFVDEFVTSNSWERADVPIEEHVVHVDLVGREWALYLHQLHVVKEIGAGGAEGGGTVGAGAAEGCTANDSAVRRSAERRLLQLCTYFNPEGDPSCDDTGDAAASLLRGLREALEKAARRQQDCESQREELFERCGARDWLHEVLPSSASEADLACAHCPVGDARRLAEAAAHARNAGLGAELALVEGELRRMAQTAVEHHQPGLQCDKCKVLAAPEEKFKSLQRSKDLASSAHRQLEGRVRHLDAFMSCLGCAGGVAQKVECVACLGDAETSRVALLPCGHMLHDSCARSVLEAQGCCPQCQRPLLAQTITGMQRHVSAEGSISALQRRCGTKLAKVIETIVAIQESEGVGTKCLVFMQWEVVMTSLERALREVGIPSLLLRGRLEQRRQIVSRFVEDNSPESSVLLLLLEQSSSGMNLSCAHHVLLVHSALPEKSEDDDAAARFELQAIGRVRCQGQAHKVHVHRFVARGTVEEQHARRRSSDAAAPAQAQAGAGAAAVAAVR